MLLYLSETKFDNIMEEIKLFHKRSRFARYLDKISVKIELKQLKIDGVVKGHDRNSSFNTHGIGSLQKVIEYLNKSKKLEEFTKNTETIDESKAYEFMGRLCLTVEDNPGINYDKSKTIFEYMMRNPDGFTTLNITLNNDYYPTLKVDCSNRYIWYQGNRNSGNGHIDHWSLSQRWDLKSSIAFVKLIVFVTKVDSTTKTIYGSPLYIAV